jgi:hypothetical protein
MTMAPLPLNLIHAANHRGKLVHARFNFRLAADNNNNSSNSRLISGLAGALLLITTTMTVLLFSWESIGGQ